MSLPQITRLLLENAVILSETEPRNGNKKEYRSYGEVRNNKATLKILSLIQILYLKQQRNILIFLQFKFEKSVFSNKFSVLYFTVGSWFIQWKMGK